MNSHISIGLCIATLLGTLPKVLVSSSSKARVPSTCQTKLGTTLARTGRSIIMVIRHILSQTLDCKHGFIPSARWWTAHFQYGSSTIKHFLRGRLLTTTIMKHKFGGWRIFGVLSNTAWKHSLASFFERICGIFSWIRYILIFTLSFSYKLGSFLEI